MTTHTDASQSNSPVTSESFKQLHTTVADKDGVALTVCELNGDITLSIGGSTDSEYVPSQQERTALREAYTPVAQDLYRIIYESDTDTDIATVFGQRVHAFVAEVPHITPESMFAVLDIDGVSRETALGYTYITQLWADGDYPRTVPPTVVTATHQLVSATPDTEQPTRSIVQSRIEDVAQTDTPVSPHVSDILLNAAAGTDTHSMLLPASQGTANTSEVAADIAQLVVNAGITDVHTATAHVFTLAGLTDVDVEDIPAIDELEPQSPTERGLTLPEDNSHNEETVRTTSSQSSDSTQQIDVESIVDELETASNTTDDALDTAWTVGSILGDVPDNGAVSPITLAERAGLSLNASDVTALQRFADVFAFSEYPSNATVDGMCAAVTTLSESDAADNGAIVQRLTSIEKYDVTLTAALVAAWRELSPVTLPAAVSIITDSTTVDDAHAALKLLYRLDGRSPPCDVMLTYVQNTNIPPDTTTDDVLAREIARIDDAYTGIAAAWERGAVIDVFTTQYEYSYTAIREVTGMPRTREQAARAVYTVYPDRDYPPSLSQSVVYRASTLHDDAMTTRTALNTAMGVSDSVTANHVYAAKEVDTVSVAAARTAVLANDIDDVTTGIQVVFALHGKDIPARTAIQDDTASARPNHPSPQADTQTDGTAPTDADETAPETAESVHTATESNPPRPNTHSSERDRTANTTPTKTQTDATAPETATTTTDEAWNHAPVVERVVDQIDASWTSDTTLAVSDDTATTLATTASTVLPTPEFYEYINEFDAITTIIPDTGWWADTLATTAQPTVTPINPVPARDVSGDTIDCDGDCIDGSPYTVTEYTDAPLLIVSPTQMADTAGVVSDRDIVATTILAYAAQGGETVCYLGELPPTTCHHAENALAELTATYTYVTSVPVITINANREALHVFTIDGASPHNGGDS